jgi:hypothetical protein
MESGGAMKIVAHTVHNALDELENGPAKIGGDELISALSDSERKTAGQRRR